MRGPENGVLRTAPVVHAASGGNSVTFNSPGNFTWTAPAGVHSVQVECWGGGQAGIPGASTPGLGGSGGGYTINGAVAVTPGLAYNLTVAAGAIYGTSPLNDSSFTGDAVTVTGHGNGGVGDTHPGGAGAIMPAPGQGCGGGGSGGTSASGNPGLTSGPGGAAVSGGGAGGDGSNTSANGQDGGFPGGGGGGESGFGGSIGGNGGDGQVVISW